MFDIDLIMPMICGQDLLSQHQHRYVEKYIYFI